MPNCPKCGQPKTEFFRRKRLTPAMASYFVCIECQSEKAAPAIDVREREIPLKPQHQAAVDEVRAMRDAHAKPPEPENPHRDPCWKERRDYWAAVPRRLYRRLEVVA